MRNWYEKSSILGYWVYERTTIYGRPLVYKRWRLRAPSETPSLEEAISDLGKRKPTRKMRAYA